MGVDALAVHVAVAIIGLDDAAQLAVAGVVEASVRGEDEELPGLVAPPDLVLADDGLHDGVKAAFRRVKISRNLGTLHFALERIK